MPFTFAHPAATLPLMRPLRRFTVPSALVIGSMMPDISHFLPVQVHHNLSHSLGGLLWFCLPMGLLCYWLFHLLLKGPLLALLPPRLFRKMGHHAAHFCALPEKDSLTVGLSILCGALTHLTWDAFTHGDTWVAGSFPVLHVHLFNLGTYPMHVHNLAQHTSSVMGLGVLACWTWRWLKKAPDNLHALPLTFNPAQRWVLWTVLAMVPLLIGTQVTWMQQALAPKALEPRLFVEAVLLAALSILAIQTVLYGIIWHLWRKKQT